MLKAETLKEIKDQLPHGALKSIQKNSGVSYLTVIKFFNGESKNTAVAKATLKEVKKYTSLMESVENCLSSHI